MLVSESALVDPTVLGQHERFVSGQITKNRDREKSEGETETQREGEEGDEGDEGEGGTETHIYDSML